MDGEYSSNEMALIFKDVDLDNKESVELGQFIKWWCSSTPSNPLLSPFKQP